MYLVGIIENKNNTIEISKILQEMQIYKKCTIMKIKQDNLDNLKNVKFDVVIINQELDVEKYKVNLDNILKNTKILILNIDYKENLKVVENLKIQVITYGFNKKATVTITSCDEDNIMLEFQREIITLNNNRIENREIKKSFKTGDNGMHFFVSIIILETISV